MSQTLGRRRNKGVGLLARGLNLWNLRWPSFCCDARPWWSVDCRPRLQSRTDAPVFPCDKNCDYSHLDPRRNELVDNTAHSHWKLVSWCQQCRLQNCMFCWFAVSQRVFPSPESCAKCAHLLGLRWFNTRKQLHFVHGHWKKNESNHKKTRESVEMCL